MMQALHKQPTSLLPRRFCTQASADRLSDQYLTLSFLLLASYEPVGETCQDFYSLGMYPEIHNDCLQFLNTKNQLLNCCWNNTNSDSVRHFSKKKI